MKTSLKVDRTQVVEVHGNDFLVSKLPPEIQNEISTYDYFRGKHIESLLALEIADLAVNTKHFQIKKMIDDWVSKSTKKSEPVQSTDTEQHED